MQAHLLLLDSSCQRLQTGAVGGVLILQLPDALCALLILLRQARTHTVCILLNDFTVVLILPRSLQGALHTYANQRFRAHAVCSSRKHRTACTPVPCSAASISCTTGSDVPSLMSGVQHWSLRKRGNQKVQVDLLPGARGGWRTGWRQPRGAGAPPQREAPPHRPTARSAPPADPASP